MDRLYVSIPYTGHEKEFPERCRKAHEKYDREYKVITPADVIRDSSTPYETCMGKCLEALLTCQYAVFSKGWDESRGCRLEHSACDIYGIRIIYNAGI